MAARVLATGAGAYSALTRLVPHPEPAVSVGAAATLAVVMDTNPDHLEGQGMQLILDLLSSPEAEPAVKAGLDWLLVCCVKHEGNRQSLLSFPGLGQQLARLCSSQDPGVVLRVCRVWVVLVQDDDVRVPFGKAHEHARMLVEDFSALEILTKVDTTCLDSMLAGFKSSPPPLQVLKA